MRPQDLVALILALGFVSMLLSGSNWMQLVGVDPHAAPVSPERVEFWTNMSNVMLGALAGYIAGRGSDK